MRILCDALNSCGSCLPFLLEIIMCACEGKLQGMASEIVRRVREKGSPVCPVRAFRVCCHTPTPQWLSPSLLPSHRANLVSSVQHLASLLQPFSVLYSPFPTTQCTLVVEPTSWDTISDSLSLHKPCHLFIVHPGFPSYRKPTKISSHRLCVLGHHLRQIFIDVSLLSTDSAPGLFYNLGHINKVRQHLCYH